ncbi:MAG: GtrA family protein [Vibrio sp.]
MLDSLIFNDLKQKLRFGMVGVVNTLVAYLAFVAIYHLLDNYIVASVLSYLVGMLVSYTLNRSFVFKAEASSSQIIPFCVVNFTALACSTLVLHTLVSSFGFIVYLAQVVAIGASMVVNYLGYKKVFTQGVSIQSILGDIRERSGELNALSLVQWGLFVVLLGVTLFNVQMSVVSNIAHDALPYMTSYTEKFVSEGRWINFAFFHTLREIPSPLAVTICDLSIFYFGYLLAKGVRKDTWTALCFGLLVVNVPYFTMLLKWPMTLLPGCFMLALFAHLRSRINPHALLVISGILLFATYPAFYFLMPLLFLSELRKASYFNIFKFLVVWALGYVLGYVVANGLVYAYTYLFSDHASFIHFADWRRSTPSNSVSALIENIGKSVDNFNRNALYLSALTPLLFVPSVCLFIWALKAHFKYTAVVVLVVISIYASVIPFGVTMPLRSGVTLPIGLGMLVLLVDKAWLRTALLVLLFIPFSYQMHDYNYGYTFSRDVMANMLEKNDKQQYLTQPENFDEILFHVDQPKTSEFMLQATGSDAFKVPSNLRLHFLYPYLYARDWPRSKMDTIDEERAQITGDITYEVKDKVLHVYIY